jgi:hypothetical protein
METLSAKQVVDRTTQSIWQSCGNQHGPKEKLLDTVFGRYPVFSRIWPVHQCLMEIIYCPIPGQNDLTVRFSRPPANQPVVEMRLIPQSRYCQVMDKQPESPLWHDSTLGQLVQVVNQASDGLILRHLESLVIEQPISTWDSNQALRDTLSVLEGMSQAAWLSTPPPDKTHIGQDHVRQLIQAIQQFR